MTVHSTQLGHNAAIFTTDIKLYTCPAGKRAIVKSIAVWNHAAAANKITLFIKFADGTFFNWTMNLAANGTNGDSDFQSMWHVLNAADELHAVATVSFAQAIVSGTELIL